MTAADHQARGTAYRELAQAAQASDRDAALEARLARVIAAVARVRQAERQAAQPAAQPGPCPRCTGRAARVALTACDPGEWWPSAQALRAHVEGSLRAEGLDLDHLPVGALVALKRRSDELRQEVRPWRA